MLVSIIINNYNYDRFLRAAIDSALGQSYHPLEVIVVDDGSTDRSRDTIASYGNQVISILKENGGQASALNAGFARSQGEVIIFLDADDVLLPDAAKLAAEVFHNNPQVSKVMYRMEIINAHGQPSGSFKPADQLLLPSGDLRRQTLAFPFDTTWMPTSGNAFARRVLLQIFPIPAKSFPILADFYLSHVAPLYGPVVSLDEIGARYRVHGNNTYELADHIVDLKHVRQTIIYAANTEAQIERYARQLGLRSRGTPTTAGSSVSCIAHRLISLKLEPALHPIPEDRVAKLLQRGVTAALRRFDVTWPVRLVFIAWFLALALAPRTMAHWLAARFLFPEKRRGVTQVLRRFHRRTETAHILQLTDDQP